MNGRAAILVAAGALIAAAPGSVLGQSRTLGDAAPGAQTRPQIMRRAPSAPTHPGIYLRIEGVPGTSTTAGHEDEIEVLSYSYGVASPRNPSTGRVSGMRQHDPVTVTRMVDKVTPFLLTALTTSRVLTKVELRFYGSTGLAYQITLTNASVVSLMQRTPDDGSSIPVEEIGLVFQEIEWLWTDGSITASDSLGSRT